MGDDIPDDIQIYAEIMMNQPVAHSCNVTPFDSRMCLHEIVRQAFCGLSKNLKIPHHCVLGFGVGAKLFV